MKPTRIDSQTYRIGNRVVFKTDPASRHRGEWRMGVPIDPEYPLDYGFVVGTVTYHRTLRDARRWAYLDARRAG